jgi:hypothetical protein
MIGTSTLVFGWKLALRETVLLGLMHNFLVWATEGIVVTIIEKANTGWR